MHPMDVVFWAALALGGIYFGAVMLLGGLSHAGSHLHHIADIGADHIAHIGGHGHGAGHGNGHAHADAGHQGHDGHHGQHDSHHGDHGHEAEMQRTSILAYLNPTLISAFFLGFGLLGVISRSSLGLNLLYSTLVASIGGLTLWGSCQQLILRMFIQAQGTSHVRQQNLVGTRATVTVQITGRQPGMVQFTASGTRMSLRAVADDEEAIQVGTKVKVRRIDSGTALVVPVEDPPTLRAWNS